MKVEQATRLFQEYQRMNLKKNTINSYRITLFRFNKDLGDRQLDSISSKEILTFLTSITEGTKRATKHS
jgi:site-specific recombinase XerD